MTRSFAPNKKGSAMVEAAIIYPLFIGTVMAVIYIIINMYISAAYKAHLNMELRREAMRLLETGEMVYMEGGALGDKFSSKAFGKKADIIQYRENGRKRLYGSFSKIYSGNKLLKAVKKDNESAIWLIDEKEYMREVDLILRE